jgi:hypothetical protein
MGGGRGKLMRISTCAIVGIGTIIINAKSIVPKNNFFMTPPPILIKKWLSLPYFFKNSAQCGLVISLYL